MAPADCVFCTHELIERQLVLETKRFYVVVDAFPMRPGHLLIIPRFHLTCFGELLPEDDEEFLRIKHEVATFLRQEFGEPVFFEHGVAGQTVPHAHLHALPGGPDLLERLAVGRQAGRIRSPGDLRSWHAAHGPYLYWEGQTGAFALTPENVEPAFFKRVLEDAGARLAWPDGTAEPTREVQRRWYRHRFEQGNRRIDVVTCFLERAGRICIFKRSDDVASARGLWHGVSGFLPEGVDPAEHAALEVEQETRLTGGQLGPPRGGSPLILTDDVQGIEWRVYPFLFPLLAGEPVLNWEHVELAWVEPAALRSYRTVRWLPALYERLRAEIG